MNLYLLFSSLPFDSGACFVLVTPLKVKLVDWSRIWLWWLMLLPMKRRPP